MSKISYSDIPVSMPRPDAVGKVFIAPANSVTIQHSAKLNRGAILAPISSPNLRLAGNLETKVTTTFPICHKFDTEDNSYNFASGILAYLTGTGSTNLTIGNRVFSGCFLDQCSIEIAPFQAATMSASFTCTNPPTGLPFISGQSISAPKLTDSFAYGHFANVSGASNFSAPVQSAISYSLNFRRTYSYAVSQKITNGVFLDEVDKQLSIKSTNITNFTNESGTSSSFAVNLFTESGILALPSGAISVSPNARLSAQNLSAQAGGILLADTTIDEAIL
jgi:hypothetical protein